MFPFWIDFSSMPLAQWLPFVCAGFAVMFSQTLGYARG
jgi:hypothetical protein